MEKDKVYAGFLEEDILIHQAVAVGDELWSLSKARNAVLKHPTNAYSAARHCQSFFITTEEAKSITELLNTCRKEEFLIAYYIIKSKYERNNGIQTE
jgi:hypothetical protein